MTRNEAREIMMQILYEMEAADEMNQEAVKKLTSERLSGNHVQRGQELLGEIIRRIDEIDGLINSCSTRWKTTRMPKVDLAIMRLAAGEILYADDVPDAVAINEAINLGKKFSTAESARFIHGVLGAASGKGREKEKTAEQE